MNFNLLDIEFRNPVILSSGPAGNGEEIFKIIPASKLGGFTTKTITLEPKEGNKPPRIVDVYGGIINSIGLQNEGFEKFMNQGIDFLESLDTNIIVSIGGYSKEEFVYMVSTLNKTNFPFIELNLSCPNVKEGKGPIGQDKEVLYNTIKECKKNTSKKIFAKFGPESNLDEMVKVCVDGGIDGITLINCPQGMRIDINTGKPILMRGFGGLSGPAIKPIAVANIFKIKKLFPKLPVIGMGGIINADDVIEFLMAGSNLTGIGTGVMIDPEIPIKIVDELSFKKFSYDNLYSKALK
jgi:dihydroorotate dehydrogenase (NAD+) catalytic subunit